MSVNLQKDINIYLNIRDQDLNGNIQKKKEYIATLSSPHAQRCVRQLLRHESFAKAFDFFLEIPGLRDAMRFSTLHKMISMKCDEVSQVGPIRTSRC